MQQVDLHEPSTQLSCLKRSVRPPRVTVLMPVYNAERFLRQAVHSILSQTFDDLELLAVDDGSTDSSLSIIEGYGDPRIRVVGTSRNLGHTHALNRGLRECRGELIARMDADDVSLPTRLERQVAFMQANPNVALVGTWAELIDEHGRVFHEVKLPCDPVEVRRTLISGNCFYHSSVMFRRDAVIASGSYRLDYSEDYDLWLRLAARHEVANIPEVLLRYRVHGEQVSLKKFRTQRRAGLKAREAMIPLWREKGWLTNGRLPINGFLASLSGERSSLGFWYQDWASLYWKMGDMSKALRFQAWAVLHSPLAGTYWLSALNLLIERTLSPAHARRVRWYAHRAKHFVTFWSSK
jgi:glycosyltransferase involved in cell wall biosynthesis